MAQIKCMLEQVRQSLRPTNRTFHGAPGGGPPFKQAIGAEAYSLESPCFVESNIAPVPHLNFYIPSFMKRLSFIHTGSDEATKCGCRLNLPQAFLAGLDSLFLKKNSAPDRKSRSIWPEHHYWQYCPSATRNPHGQQSSIRVNPLDHCKAATRFECRKLSVMAGALISRTFRFIETTGSQKTGGCLFLVRGAL